MRLAFARTWVGAPIAARGELTPGPPVANATQQSATL